MELLEISIRALHRLVGNVADIDSYHILIAPGSTPLIPASLFGLYLLLLIYSLCFES